MKRASRRSLLQAAAAAWAAGSGQEARGLAAAGPASPLAGDELARRLLQMSDAQLARLEEARRQGLLELAPVNLPTPDRYSGDNDHFGWPVATMIDDTLIVSHRRIIGHAHGGGPEDGRDFDLLGRRPFTGWGQDLVRAVRSARLHEAPGPHSRRLHPAVAPLSLRRPVARPPSRLQAAPDCDRRDERRRGRRHQRSRSFSVRTTRGRRGGIFRPPSATTRCPARSCTTAPRLFEHPNTASCW